ncbi:lipopolysaccharide biosynthesis protein [Sphaerobacter sp.]|uniref:YveK family protein n=1 Tax=Sphaerobacter sp. TaxID=2099654 RepID=UPI001D955BE1|nr:lipopolysaccharide biosynthesis protein [Sphaerobacter sp.]MBX5445140.1 lipopolysaccharide biosynthesis protein [Sphaerobacter sp.]
MRPEEYALIVLRRWWLVLLAAVVAGGVAYAYSISQPKTYQVSARLMAIAEPPDYWMDLYAKNRLASYGDLINNGPFVAEALQRANLDIDVGQAMSGLAVGRNSDSNVIQVVKTDTDPERAAAVVNALAAAFVARAEEENAQLVTEYPTGTEGVKRNTVRIEQLDTPGPPSTPIGPRVKLNTAAALLLGLVVGVLLTFAAEYLEDTLRTEEDVDRYLALPTVAAIPRT